MLAVVIKRMAVSMSVSHAPTKPPTAVLLQAVVQLVPNAERTQKPAAHTGENG